MNLAARTVDLLSLFPTVKCISPRLAMKTSILGIHMEILSNQHFPLLFCVDLSQIGMDDGEFKSSMFQRVYQYLKRHDSSPNLLDQFRYEGKIEGNITDCLQHILK